MALNSHFSLVICCVAVLQCLKGDSNPYDYYVSNEGALLTLDVDTSIIKIGCTMRKLWSFKESNMTDFEYIIIFHIFYNSLILRF